MHNLFCDVESEWDLNKLKMHIQDRQNEGPEDLYFDMEDNMNQRAASRESKIFRAQVAQQVPSQPKRARRTIPGTIVAV